MTNVINSLRSENKTYAMVAPAIEGQFGTASVKAIKAAVKALGFYDVYEAALGADAVAWREAEELIKNKEEGKKMTTSCCPAFVNLVKKHFPTVADNVSTMVSPMVAAARLIQKKDPHADIVFIGPCIAKKNEVVSQYLGEINAAITFEELKVMFRVKGINPEDFEDANEDATLYGKGFARSGGVSAAVMKVIEEKGVDTSIFKACKCSGAAECKKALTLLKVGRLPEDIIEGMACEGGCVNGPGKIQDLPVSKKVFDKYADNQNTEIIANSTEKGMAELNIHRH
jgi:ferredoxin hydrogenase large subunit